MLPSDHAYLVCDPVSYLRIIAKVVFLTILTVGFTALIYRELSRLPKANWKQRYTIERRIGWNAAALLLLVPFWVLILDEASSRIWARYFETPPWEDAATPTQALVEGKTNEAVVAAAPEHIMRLLRLDPSINEEELFCWRGAVARIPDMVAFRSRPVGERKIEIETSYSDTLVFAEAHDGSERPICIYVDEVAQGFGPDPALKLLRLTDPLAREIYVGYLALHELAHLPPQAGGALRDPAYGDIEKGGRLQPTPEHVALHEWIADLAARDFRQAQDSNELDEATRRARMAAACFVIEHTNLLLRGADGDVARMNAHQKKLGPPTFGLRDRVDIPQGCAR